MSEPKPIVVIYIPENYDLGNGTSSASVDIMSMLNGFDNDKYKQSYHWKDYLWFCWVDYEIQTPRFEVFYPKDFTEIQYEELRQLVENQLKQLTA